MKHVEKAAILINIVTTLALLITALFAYFATALPARAGEAFIVDLKIEEDYKHVIPKQEVVAKVQIGRINGDEKEDIKLIVAILDLNNTVVSSRSSTVAIQTTLSTLERIIVPSFLKPGTYFLKVQLTKQNEVLGESSETFYVEKPTASKVITYSLSQKSLYILIAVLLAFMVITIINQITISHLKGQVHAHRYDIHHLTNKEERKVK